jgi:hypothetical protein
MEVVFVLNDNRILWYKMSLLIVSIIAICSLLAVIIFTELPASAEEKAEQMMKDKMGSEFLALDKVELTEELEGINGKYYRYNLYDSNGEMIGIVTEDASTGDILSIGYEYEPNYGEPKLSLVEAHKIAKEYLSKWGYILSDEYALVGEELTQQYSDIGDKHAYIYQLTWVRRAGDITIAEDGCSIEIDAIGGDVIYCGFPAGINKDFSIAETIKPQISKEDALSIARSNCPSPETWYQSMSLDSKEDLKNVDIRVAENIEYIYVNIDKEYRLIERVHITYEYYPKQVEANEENRIGIKGYVIEIDGVTGEILGINQTL